MFVHVNSLSEQKQNPDAVVNALRAYDNSVRHVKEDKYLVEMSVEDIPASSDDAVASNDSETEVQTDTEAPAIPDKKHKEAS